MKILILLLSIFFSSQILALPNWLTGRSGITGNYSCTWYRGGSALEYESSLEITKLRATYRFSWTTSNNKQLTGTGLFNEKDDSLIAAIFTDVANPRNRGLEIFKVQPNGNLTGIWSYENSPLLSVENCVKKST